jgi:protein-S-isoprenylcysteine O-methyltransferase Ste14
MIMSEILQVVGALLVLAGFTATQLGRLNPDSVPYLVANIAGAGILAVIAAAGHDWGFLLLEGVWTVVSAVSLVRTLRGQPVMPGKSASPGHR